MTNPSPEQRPERRPDQRPDERGLVGSAVDGRYEIREVLGVGGMSTVYRAHDTRLERDVAIKVISPSLGADDSFLRRFASEARASARLAHPNIVHVLDRSAEQSLPYIVFEYVPGRTLRTVVAEESPLSGRAALRLWRQLVEALSSAHESGLVHRDVKPDNVLVTDRGIAKLTDFGLARAVAEARTTATIMGTARYVAPEVITDSHSDARSDIYSAGVVLFELLTGVPPFAGSNPINVAYAHVHREVPPPSKIEPDVHPELDSLVTWCCAKDPENRPVSAQAVLTELDHIVTLLPAEPPRPPRPPRPPADTVILSPQGPDATAVETEAATQSFASLPPFLTENDDETQALPRTASAGPGGQDGRSRPLESTQALHRVQGLEAETSSRGDFGPLTAEDEETSTGYLPSEADRLGLADDFDETAAFEGSGQPQNHPLELQSIHSYSGVPESRHPAGGPMPGSETPKPVRRGGSSVRREKRERAKSARQPLRSVRKSGNSTLTTFLVILLTCASLGLAAFVYGISRDSGTSVFQVGQALPWADAETPGAVRSLIDC